MSNVDQLQTCPYNTAHQILTNRFQTHLLKCSKQNVNDVKEKCPFNSTHHLRGEEIQHHLTVCKDRIGFDSFKHPVRRAQQLDVLPVQAVNDRDLENDEDWDAEPPCSSYLPERNIMNNPIIRTFVGGSKSERKLFRQQERLRHQMIEDGQPMAEFVHEHPSTSAGAAAAPADEAMKPLRTPKQSSQASLRSNIQRARSWATPQEEQVWPEIKPVIQPTFREPIKVRGRGITPRNIESFASQT